LSRGAVNACQRAEQAAPDGAGYLHHLVLGNPDMIIGIE